MTYEQALAFWFGRVNFEQSVPDPSDLKLDRMRALFEQLGNPQAKFRIVHIAGSKGKGSTSAMLAAILRRAGYRTGLFTSPHLVRVEERIEVDDEAISAAELAALMSEVAQAVRRLDAQSVGWVESSRPTEEPVARVESSRPTQEGAVTFFEVATALGFLHFERRRVDVAVVEVGLGGRFDSTNVCQPLVSVITSISYDHTQQLGNTLAKIAMEKAGIVKPGRPAISGARAPGARAVIEHICRQRRSPLCQLDVDFRYAHQPACVQAAATRWPRVEIVTRRRSWPGMEIGLLGEHQAANAALAVAAVEQLNELGLSIGDAAVAAGLAQVRWPARLEVLARQPLVILDCAHNLASAQALVDTLRASFPQQASARRLLIFAGNRDKDLGGMLNLLAPHFDHVYVTRFANSLRCLAPEQIAGLLPKAWGHTICPSSELAWQKARAAAGPGDLICVTGSVFLAGELRPIMIDDLQR